MLEALEAQEVDMVIVDSFALASEQYTSMLDDKSLKIASIIDIKSGYGVVLSGLTRALVNDITNGIMFRSSFISDEAALLKAKQPVSN